MLTSDPVECTGGGRGVKPSDAAYPHSACSMPNKWAILACCAEVPVPPATIPVPVAVAFVVALDDADEDEGGTTNTRSRSPSGRNELMGKLPDRRSCLLAPLLLLLLLLLPVLLWLLPLLLLRSNISRISVIISLWVNNQGQGRKQIIM